LPPTAFHLRGWTAFNDPPIHAVVRGGNNIKGYRGTSMKIRSSFAPQGVALVAAMLIAIGFGAEVLAQTPPAQPKAAPQAAPKGPAPKGPTSVPAQGAQPAAPEAPQSTQAAAVPTPWTKRCVEEPQTKKQICEVAQALLAETGQFLMSATFSELQDNPRKGFTIVAPIGMLLPPGIRIHVDAQQLPNDVPYAVCIAPPNQSPACIAEMEVDQNFINTMKKAQTVRVQVINAQRRTIDFVFSMKDFAKAYDGAPIDEKAMQAQRQKLQDELQKRAEEARKKLESQQKQ
jgi:invasion protein IalB